MPSINDLKGFLLNWNSTFPLDKKYRERYSIAFNSIAHRDICQIDIYFEWLENKIYEEMIEQASIDLEKETQLKKGKIVLERKVNTKEEIDLFDSIDLNAAFNNIKIED